VYVTSTGQLGVLASSERYKTSVASMGASSEKLRELRPVTYRLRADRKGQTQYGLIAEEVAKVYPELVIRGDKRRIEGVRLSRSGLVGSALRDRLTRLKLLGAVKDDHA
jgi:hypothetical protein